MKKMGRPIKYEEAEEPIITQFEKARIIGSYMVCFADGTRRNVERTEAIDVLTEYHGLRTTIEKDNFAKYLAKEKSPQKRSITLPGSVKIGGEKEWQTLEFQDLDE